MLDPFLTNTAPTPGEPTTQTLFQISIGAIEIE